MLRFFVLWAALSFSCRSASDIATIAPATPEQPFAVVLGTAQDGGLPQIGCVADCCERVRLDPSQARRVTSLLLVDPRTQRRWLFDASPDLGEQVELANRVAPRPAFDDEGRRALFDGIFLTHAHMGHYAGLLQLGREAYGVAAPIFGSARMLDYLGGTPPWSAVLQARGAERRQLEPGQTVELAPDLRVQALLVPHRDEYSDTFAFLIQGPSRALLYLPDIDKWERWGTPIETLLERVDVALLDGTFFGPGEVPGRDLAEIPHPFIVESLRRFADLPESLRERVRFTHLNHSNPAAVPEGPEAREVRAAGMGIAAELEVHTL